MEGQFDLFREHSIVITRRRGRCARRPALAASLSRRAAERDLRIAERLIPELKAAPWVQHLDRRVLLTLADFEPDEQRRILDQADTPLRGLLEQRTAEAARALVGQHRTIGIPPEAGVCWIGTRLEDQWDRSWKEDPRILLISPSVTPRHSTVQGIFADPDHAIGVDDGDFSALEALAERFPLEFSGRKVVRWSYREKPLPSSQLWGFLCLSGWSFERRHWRAAHRTAPAAKGP